MFCFLFEEIIHVVEAGRLAGEEEGGGEGAASEGVAGVGGVGEGEALFGGVEEEGVLADDGAGAKGVDGGGVGDGFGEREGGAAGFVFFVGVVGFDEIDVGIGESGSGLLGEFVEERHAESKVGGVEERDVLGGVVEQGEISFGEAGGADDDRFVMGDSGVEVFAECGGDRDVDEEIGGEMRAGSGNGEIEEAIEEGAVGSVEMGRRGVGEGRGDLERGIL